jgi:hypothetical protein
VKRGFEKGNGAWLLVAVFGITASAAAQTSVEQIKRSTEERSQDIAEYRALFTDPDPSVRLAALDMGLKSDDVALREIAYEVGLKSSDEAMRAVALKGRISDLATIVIKFGPRDEATDREKRAVARWGGTYAFGIANFDEKTGRFETTAGTDTTRRKPTGNGQVAGTAPSFSTKSCNGTFQLGDRGLLRGTLGCRGAYLSGEFVGSINIQ